MAKDADECACLIPMKVKPQNTPPRKKCPTTSQPYPKQSENAEAGPAAMDSQSCTPATGNSLPPVSCRRHKLHRTQERLIQSWSSHVLCFRLMIDLGSHRPGLLAVSGTTSFVISYTRQAKRVFRNSAITISPSSGRLCGRISPVMTLFLPNTRRNALHFGSALRQADSFFRSPSTLIFFSFAHLTVAAGNL